MYVQRVQYTARADVLTSDGNRKRKMYDTNQSIAYCITSLWWCTAITMFPTTVLQGKKVWIYGCPLEAKLGTYLLMKYLPRDS